MRTRSLQAEGALGELVVRFWMHNGMLNLTEVKMSKSLGNILTLRDVLDKYRPEALIAAFLGSHYRSPLEFSAELLAEAEQQVDRLRNLFREVADAAARTTPQVPARSRAAATASNPSAASGVATGPPLTVAGAALLERWRRGARSLPTLWPTT